MQTLPFSPSAVTKARIGSPGCSHRTDGPAISRTVAIFPSGRRTLLPAVLFIETQRFPIGARSLVVLLAGGGACGPGAHASGGRPPPPSPHKRRARASPTSWSSCGGDVSLAAVVGAFARLSTLLTLSASTLAGKDVCAPAAEMDNASATVVTVARQRRIASFRTGCFSIPKVVLM
jgi:hypothetical protein